jgi:uncharacterized protein YecE (DUF72 family)
MRTVGRPSSLAVSSDVFMSTTLPLFEEPQPDAKQNLGPKLAKLASQQLYIGTSSWKYEGWLDQVYTPERYFVRGRFSRRKFEAECLAEYADTFPVVCGDFSFYQFPTAEFWEKLFGSSPSALKIALKVPEEITVRVFPIHARCGARAGVANPNFLNAELLKSEFLNLLEPFAHRVAVVIFEFGSMPKSAFSSTAEFLNVLEPLMLALPRGFRYAVEIRNAEFLQSQYFEMLREQNIAHVFNSWTRMPSISHQMRVQGSFTADFVVARALLRMGRKYERAVQQFSPYLSVQEPNHEVREALRNLLVRAKQRSEPAYIFVNNRLEGNAPGTIEAVVDSL